jgi:cyanophycin synthetase
MAQRAARAADVEVAGVDYITTDISRSYRETGGKICEINTYVSLAPHRVAHPERGVIAPLVDRVFPPGEDGRIPVAVATGRGPCGAVVRSLAAILEAAGLTCGAATEQEVRIGGEVVARGNHATRRGAEIVLIDPACRSAALALDPADLAARGLAFDRCTVVAISGYAELEDAGREAVERLAGAAREAVVIEAGDAAALKMARALDGRRIVLVAGAGAKMPGKLPAGAALFHAEADSTGTLKLMLRDGKRREAVCPAPAADEDALSHALAAAVIAYAMGRPLETIAAGLAAMPESARRSAS